jgi:hypothetical protein
MWNVPFRQDVVSWVTGTISHEHFIGLTKLNLKGRNTFVLGLSTLGDTWIGDSGETGGGIDDSIMEEYRELVFVFAAQCRGESKQTIESC